jgi:CheY-like chemotaxis protein
MSDHQVQILLVEDNPNDIKLALHAFKTHNLANDVHVVRDGAEALEFIFGTDRYAGRSLATGPKLILLDLKLPLVEARGAAAINRRAGCMSIVVAIVERIATWSRAIGWA